MPLDSDQFDFFVSYARGDNASGSLTRFVAELPGLVGKTQPSEQQGAQTVADLCRLPAPHDAFVAATSPVVKQLRRRDFSQPQVQTFFTAGLEALRREDLRAVLESLAKDL